MDARKQAAELAKMGRYGDTMLMHVNPQEVAGLASIMPVTINPQTGQPEAFVGAILGSLLGGTIFPNLLGAGLVGSAGGAAFGSGLGTYLETGDLEKGIASAVLGYGAGQIMGDVATAGGEDMISQGYTQQALNENMNLAAQQAVQQAEVAANVAGSTLDPQLSARIAETARQQAANQGLTGVQLKDVAGKTADSLNFAYENMSPTERMTELGKNLVSSDTVGAVADNYLPIALGGGSLAAQNAQDQYLQDMDMMRAEREKRKKEMYAKYPEVIHSRNPYLSYFSAEGGQIPSYQEGRNVTPKRGGLAGIKDAIRNQVNSSRQTPIMSEEEREKAIKFYYEQMGKKVPSYQEGGEVVYGVGNEGQFRPSNTYMPGIDSEFNFFPNRVIPASAISAAQAAAGETQEFTPPPILPSTYQPMVLPDYDYDAVPTGSVLARVQDAYNAGLPTTTQLLSPFRNVGLEGAVAGAGRTFTAYGSDVTGANANKVQTGADTYVNTDNVYDTGSGKTNMTDSDLTNNPGSTVIDNNDGTSTVIYEDGTTTTVANQPYTESVTVTSNTDPVTGNELQPGDAGYVDPDSEDFSSATYAYGTGGGPQGQNPYLGDPATTMTQVEANRATLREAAAAAGVQEAYDAAIAAGVPADKIVIGTDPSAVSKIVKDNPDTEEDESSIIVGPTGYGKQGSLEDGTFVYTNTNPALGYVADSTENYYPKERRVATSGILISPDGTRTQINDLSTFKNPMDGSVIELNNGYSVLNVPEVGDIRYSGVGMYADDPSYGGAYERDPAVVHAENIYKTLSRTEQADKRTEYQQALADALARGDIPSADYQKLKEQTYEEYLAYLEAKEAEEAEEKEEEKEKEVEETEEDKKFVDDDEEKESPAYVSSALAENPILNLSNMSFAGMQQGMQVPDMSREMSLQQEIREAVLGNHPNPDSVIQAYIEQFGVDAFLQARDTILRQQVPNAQTQGLVQGIGGGMEDNIMGMIGNQQGVAVSPGEYIIPADVVSMLGDGNTDEGSDKLDNMLDRVRVEKTGTTKQAKPLGNKKVMAG